MIKINLSRILGERKMSQTELADRAGVRKNAVSELYNEERWVSGKKEPIKRIDLDILNRICKALGDIQLGELLEYVRDEESTTSYED